MEPASATHYHPTQFLLDFNRSAPSSEGLVETMEQRIKRDPDYDTAFINAWEWLNSLKGISFKDGTDALEKLQHLHGRMLAQIEIQKFGPYYETISQQKIEDEEKQALDILNSYCMEMKKGPEEPLTLIASTVHALAQLHLYSVQERHTLYLFSNFLLSQYGLSPSYPSSLSMFMKGKSDQATVDHELRTGQERFTTLFSNAMALNEGLRRYAETVWELTQMCKEVPSLHHMVQGRKFALLLTKLVKEKPIDISLIEYLIGHASILNLALTAIGKKGWDQVCKMAKEQGNETLPLLLKGHDLISSHSLSL